MTIANEINELGSRGFTQISAELNQKIRKGEFIEQNWHCDQYPGSWTYKVNDKFVEIRIVNQSGFNFEAMYV